MLPKHCDGWFRARLVKPTRRRVKLVASLGLLEWMGFSGAFALGCSSGAPTGGEPTEKVDLPIYGGQNATTCQWPTTVLLGELGCTGTLVHPSIVVTAAHFGTSERMITFGESESSPARNVAVEFFRAFPRPNGPTQTHH